MRLVHHQAPEGEIRRRQSRWLGDNCPSGPKEMMCLGHFRDLLQPYRINRRASVGARSFFWKRQASAARIESERVPGAATPRRNCGRALKGALFLRSRTTSLRAFSQPRPGTRLAATLGATSFPGGPWPRPLTIAVKDQICAGCRGQDHEGHCPFREAGECALWTYIPLLVDAVEEVTQALRPPSPH